MDKKLLDELFKMNGMNVTKELRDISIIEKEVQKKLNMVTLTSPVMSSAQQMSMTMVTPIDLSRIIGR